MMTPPQWVLLALSAGVALTCWLRRHLPAPEDQPHRVGFEPHACGFCLGGCILCALLAPFAAWTGVPAAAWAMVLFASGFALLSPVACLQAIRYGDGGVTLRTCLGFVHTLQWEDVTGVRPGRGGWMLLCTTRRRFVLNPQAKGCAEFIRHVLRREKEKP